MVRILAGIGFKLRWAGLYTQATFPALVDSGVKAEVYNTNTNDNNNDNNNNAEGEGEGAGGGGWISGKGHDGSDCGCAYGGSPSREDMSLSYHREFTLRLNKYLFRCVDLRFNGLDDVYSRAPFGTIFEQEQVRKMDDAAELQKALEAEM